MTKWPDQYDSKDSHTPAALLWFPKSPIVRHPKDTPEIDRQRVIMIDFEEYPVVTENSRDYLNQRQLVDYRSEREECLRWLLTYGKEPKKHG